MRTLYFLEPGQKLNDTKPSERKRALLMTNQEWNKFSDHLTRKQMILEAAEREREEIDCRKLLSKEMAKSWDNTIINIRKRRIENRRKQIEQLEKDRRKRFLEMRKEEENNKKKIIDEAKQMLRRDKDNAKSLISALRFSEVLRERAEQVKFENKLKEIEVQKEKAYAEKLKSDWEKYKLELKAEKEEEINKKTKLSEQVKNEMADFTKRKTEEKELEIQLDIEDNERVLEEMRVIEENEKKEKERKRQLVLRDIEENRKLIEDYEEQCRREREEEEAAIHIHAVTKKTIAKIKRDREMEEAKTNQIRREEISKAVAAKVQDKESEENKRIQKAIAEREQRENELLEKRKQYQKNLMQELKKERLDQLERENEEKRKEKELLKLSVMQRLKNCEVNDEFTGNMREKEREIMRANRLNWDQQCRELEETRAAERAEDINAVARAVEFWNLEDKVFLEYADTVLDESRAKSRPLLPMVKYIQQFKKDVGLTARPKLHKTWISRVPINNKLFECPAAKRQEQVPWPSQKDIKQENTSIKL